MFKVTNCKSEEVNSCILEQTLLGIGFILWVNNQEVTNVVLLCKNGEKTRMFIHTT